LLSLESFVASFANDKSKNKKKKMGEKANFCFNILLDFGFK